MSSTVPSLDNFKTQITFAVQQLAHLPAPEQNAALDFLHYCVDKVASRDMTTSTSHTQTKKYSNKRPKISGFQNRQDSLLNAIPATHNLITIAEHRPEARKTLKQVRNCSPKKVSPTRKINKPIFNRHNGKPINMKLRCQNPKSSKSDSKTLQRVTNNPKPKPSSVKRGKEMVISCATQDMELKKNLNRKKQPPCNLCGKKVKKALLLKHVSEHNGTSLSCNRCKKTFKNMVGYNYHKSLNQCIYRTSDGKGATYTFNKKETHNIITKTLHCPFCGERFSKGYNLRRHISQAVCLGGKDVAKNKCKHCHIKMPNEAALQDHIDNKHCHPCGICTETFPTDRLQREHRKMQHSTQSVRSSNPCNVCSESFKTQAQLKLHAKKHAYSDTFVSQSTEKATKKFSCNKCCYQTCKMSNLSRHAQALHSESPRTRLVCHRCPATLAHKQALNEHMQSVHSENEQSSGYICDICGKTFKMKSYLQRHLVCHEEAAHRCTLCPRAFRRKDKLKQHVGTQHGEGNKRLAPGQQSTKQKLARSSQTIPFQTSSEQMQPVFDSNQLLSVIDVQSGEMVTMSASDYSYNLLFKNSILSKPENCGILTSGETGVWNVQTPALYLLNPQESVQENPAQYTYITSTSTLVPEPMACEKKSIVPTIMMGESEMAKKESVASFQQSFMSLEGAVSNILIDDGFNGNLVVTDTSYTSCSLENGNASSLNVGDVSIENMLKSRSCSLQNTILPNVAIDSTIRNVVPILTNVDGGH